MKLLAIDPTGLTAPALESACRQALGPDLAEFTLTASAAAALVRLAAESFDLVLQCRSAADVSGATLLVDRPNLARHTIVLSADPAHAVDAYEHGALDFVPLPVHPARLAKALHRGAQPGAAGSPDPRLIAVRRHGRINLVPVDDLLYVEAADKYSELVLRNGERSFHDQGLARLESTLPRSFVRIHKSYLVRFPMVARLLVRRGSRYFAVLRTGQQLPVGRSRYAELKARLI